MKRTIRITDKIKNKVTEKEVDFKLRNPFYNQMGTPSVLPDKTKKIPRKIKHKKNMVKELYGNDK